MALAIRIEDKMDGGGVGEKTNAMNGTSDERQVGYCRLQEGIEGRMDGTRVISRRIEARGGKS